MPLWPVSHVTCPLSLSFVNPRCTDERAHGMTGAIIVKLGLHSPVFPFRNERKAQKTSLSNLVSMGSRKTAFGRGVKFFIHISTFSELRIVEHGFENLGMQKEVLRYDQELSLSVGGDEIVELGCSLKNETGPTDIRLVDINNGTPSSEGNRERKVAHSQKLVIAPLHTHRD